jgi:hypothetical protein
MKTVLILLLSFLALNATVYYSKVEPLEVKKITSNVMGLVLFTDEDMLGKKLENSPYIKIDSELDRDDLKFSEEKLEYIRETVAVNEEILENLKKSLDKKRVNYKKVKALKIKSSVEKDREFYELIASENSYLSTKKEINNLKSQITDLKLRIAQLKRSIKDKNLNDEGYVLYSLDVKMGQVVNKATPLATLMNIDKAILTIYLDARDLADVKSKTIYINGEKTEYKISRLLTITDSENISKYKAQIIIDAPKVFSKLVEIELKKSKSE